MVYDQIDRHERLYDAGVFAEACHARTHRRQVNQQRHTREILQQDARDDEGYLFGALGIGPPVGEFAYVFLDDFLTVEITQDGFEDDADADRQFGDWANALFFQLGQRIELARGEGLQRIEEIMWHKISSGCVGDKHSSSLTAIAPRETLTIRVIVQSLV